MRVLVTGGFGFIGSHLVEGCLRRGDTVRVLDNLLPQVHARGLPTWAPRGLPMHVADVADVDALYEALDGIDVVFHLAAETGTGQSMYESRRYVRTNVGGTATLIEAIQRRGRPLRVVLASSRALYGEGMGACVSCERAFPLPARSGEALARGRWENSCPDCGAPCKALPMSVGQELRPTSIYGVTKLAQEDLLRVAAAAGTLRCWSLRLQNVFGPRQALGNPYTGLLAVFFTRLSAGKPCELYEDGKTTRDFVYVDDAVDALLRAGRTESGGFQVVDVGSGQPLTIRKIEAELRALLGVADCPPRVEGRFRPGDIRHAFADFRPAMSALGWRSTTSLRSGLARFVEWARNEPMEEDRSDEALREIARRGMPTAAESPAGRVP